MILSACPVHPSFLPSSFLLPPGGRNTLHNNQKCSTPFLPEFPLLQKESHRSDLHLKLSYPSPIRFCFPVCITTEKRYGPCHTVSIFFQKCFLLSLLQPFSKAFLISLRILYFKFVIEHFVLCIRKSVFQLFFNIRLDHIPDRY